MSPDQIVLEDFIDKQPFSVAQVLEKLNIGEVAEFLRGLHFEKCLRLLELMKVEKAAHCLFLLPQELTDKLMENGSVSFAENLSRQLDEEFRENLFARLSPSRATLLRKRLEQSPNTVGALMVSSAVANREMNAKEALAIIRENRDSLGLHLYVVNSNGILEGAILLNDFLWADKKIPLEELMNTAVPKFLSDTPVKAVLDHPVWETYRQIPVVDTSEKLLGVLSHKTIIEMGKEKSGHGREEILETGKALGELYLIGLTGLLQSVGK